MNSDDPAVLDILRRCMVARIATLSRSGRPSIRASIRSTLSPSTVVSDSARPNGPWRLAMSKLTRG